MIGCSGDVGHDFMKIKHMIEALRLWVFKILGQVSRMGQRETNEEVSE